MTCARCPAFVFAPESLESGLCHGCRSPAGAAFVPERAEPEFAPQVAPPGFVLALAERIFAQAALLARRAERRVWDGTERDTPQEG